MTFVYWGTEMNWLDLQSEGQGHDCTKDGQKSTFGPFCYLRTLHNDSLNWFQCGSVILDKMSSKVKVLTRLSMVIMVESIPSTTLHRFYWL